MTSDEIRILEQAATPGVWSTSEADPGVVTDTDGKPIAVFGGGTQDRQDAAFTAAARQSVPLLLARIAELEAQLNGGQG